MAEKGFRSKRGIAAPPYTGPGPYEFSEPLTIHKQGLAYERYELYTHFDRLPQLNATIDQVYTVEAARAASQDFELLGVNATDLDVTFSATIAGLQLQTDGGSGDQIIILPHLDTLATAWAGINWGTENQVIWECVLRTDASVADVTIWAGLKLTNTSVVATDADAAYFRFDGVVANWEATTSIGGTDVETDTGIAVTASTNYYLKIEIDSSRRAHFFIDNVEVFVSGALTDDINLIPYIGVQDTAAAAKTIHLASQKISRLIFE